jgi:hypothetical protein
MAEAEAKPSNTPGGLSEHGRFLGRFIFQKSATNAAAVQNVADAVFANAGVTAHANLTGLTAQDHPASAITILDTAADFTATDVEGALAELQADNEAHLADTTSVHQATSLGVTSVKQTILLTAEGATLAQTSGATRAQIESTTNKINEWVCAFADGATSYISWKFVLPDNWDGAALVGVIVWHTAATTNNMRWQVDAVMRGDSDALDTSFTAGAGAAGVVDEAADGTTLDLNYSAAISFTPGGTLAGGKEIVVRVAREGADANDTCTEIGYFHEMKLEYGINALSA